MKPINTTTETVLRNVINDYPYHKQFAPLLDEIDRLRSVLATLREPSEAVSKAAADEMYGIDVDGVSSGAEAMYRAAATRVIRAAVSTAEKEVTNEN